MGSPKILKLNDRGTFSILNDMFLATTNENIDQRTHLHASKSWKWWSWAHSVKYWPVYWWLHLRLHSSLYLQRRQRHEGCRRKLCCDNISDQRSCIVYQCQYLGLACSVIVLNVSVAEKLVKLVFKGILTSSNAAPYCAITLATSARVGWLKTSFICSANVRLILRSLENWKAGRLTKDARMRPWMNINKSTSSQRDSLHALGRLQICCYYPQLTSWTTPILDEDKTSITQSRACLLQSYSILAHMISATVYFGWIIHFQTLFEVRKLWNAVIDNGDASDTGFWHFCISISVDVAVT